VHTKKTQVLQQAVCATGGAALPRCAVQITFLKSLRRCDRKGDVQVMGRSRWMHNAWQRSFCACAQTGTSTQPDRCHAPPKAANALSACDGTMRY
jgi:hypothetical protein